MKLYAISDLHLNYRVNLQAVEAQPPHPEDWLILAGDIADTEAHLQYALALLSSRFKQLIWVPGNHELWTLPIDRSELRGAAKYNRLVSICRDYGVLTPEDPYVYWPGAGGKYLLVPLFLLYDYTFRPDHIPVESALDWAIESGVICTDEDLLHPDPYKSRAEWCARRCRLSEERLKEVPDGASLILINHFPLRQDLINLLRYPRFTIWCGTRCTEDWHSRFRVSKVVYGHLHIRGTYFRDGVRFEEVSLGYPRNWHQERGLEYYFREILP
jgi:3',5'-cyclic AMP phosphodiesterase CpdA